MELGVTCIEKCDLTEQEDKVHVSSYVMSR